jgi:hypothetical protein
LDHLLAVKWKDVFDNPGAHRLTGRRLLGMAEKIQLDF